VLVGDVHSRGYLTVADITERKQRQRELQRQKDRLEEFAGVVSHDLRNPLNVAQGRLDLLEEESESEHLDHISRSLDRIEEIIEDTLTLAKQGQTVGDTERTAIADLLVRCWQEAETADATLEIAEEFSIRGDPSRLRHLFENLIRNAVEHGGEGVTVRVGLLDERGFYFEDDGPGIPEDERESVMEAGYSTATGGTGFGLSIVNRIAEAHGWQVAITDGTDGGARFECTGVEILP
jgi:signal transduction histidine kinase